MVCTSTRVEEVRVSVQISSWGEESQTERIIMWFQEGIVLWTRGRRDGIRFSWSRSFRTERMRGFLFGFQGGGEESQTERIIMWFQEGIVLWTRGRRYGMPFSWSKSFRAERMRGFLQVSRRGQRIPIGNHRYVAPGRDCFLDMRKKRRKAVQLEQQFPRRETLS